jgi:hypothetical protein
LLSYGAGGADYSLYVTEIGISGNLSVRDSGNVVLLESLNPAGSFRWVLKDSTNTAIDSAFTKTASFNIDTVGLFSIYLSVERSNLLSRYFPHGLKIRPPPFEEGDADLVLDLDAIEAGTFSNPLGDASIAGNGTTNFAYDFGGVVRPDFKIYVKGTFNGRINLVGLRGSSYDHPVTIQGPTTGQAVFTATNGSQPYAIQLTGGPQHIVFNGASSSTDHHSIKFEGYTAGATAGQIVFVQGSDAKGLVFIQLEIDGRKNDPGSLATGGGAALQIQPPTPTVGQNGENYSYEYIVIYNCYIHDNFGEGIYVGYFSDARQSGLRPARMGYLLIFDNVIERTHRDGTQWASTDGYQIFRNTIKNTGEEANASHISAFSLNDGNATGYVYQNHVDSTDLFISAQSGATGSGNHYIFSNFGRQRETILAGTGNQFAYLALDSAVVDYHFVNNTIVSPDVSVAPVAIQHNVVSFAESENFTFAGNVISTGGTDQATWPELRRVNTPSNTSNWFISNVWERTADEADLLLDAEYKPDTVASPAFGGGFDWSTRFSDSMPSEQRDIDGYALKTGTSPDLGLGWTAGAYSGITLWIPDTTNPVIDSVTASNILETTLDVNIYASENSTQYFVIVPNNSGQPSAAQIIAGNNASGSPATDSGNDVGKSTTQAVSGLTGDTTYEIFSVVVDGSGNQSAVDSVEVSTVSSASQVVLAEIGTTSGTVGVTQRASTGTLTPPLAVTGGDFAAGDLLICMVSIRATGGTTNIAASGWSQIATHRMGTTSNGEFYIWGKIADGTETGSVTVSFPNDFGVTKMARCFRFKNNNSTSVAAAVESIASGQGTSTTYAAQSVTSTTNLSLAVQFVAVADDNVTGSFTGESGGDYTEDATYVYTGGTGGAHSVQTAELATAGSITGGTYVMTASDPWGVIGLIIKP